MARWQRERRQQTIIVTLFSAILFFVLQRDFIAGLTSGAVKG